MLVQFDSPWAVMTAALTQLTVITEKRSYYRINPRLFRLTCTGCSFSLLYMDLWINEVKTPSLSLITTVCSSAFMMRSSVHPAPSLRTCEVSCPEEVSSYYSSRSPGAIVGRIHLQEADLCVCVMLKMLYSIYNPLDLLWGFSVCQGRLYQALTLAAQVFSCGHQ